MYKPSFDFNFRSKCFLKLVLLSLLLLIYSLFMSLQPFRPPPSFFGFCLCDLRYFWHFLEFVLTCNIYLHIIEWTFSTNSNTDDNWTSYFIVDFYKGGKIVLGFSKSFLLFYNRICMGLHMSWSNRRGSCSQYYALIWSVWQTQT